MRKPLRHPIGSGAMGVGGPWTRSAKQDQQNGTPVRRRLGQIIMLSFLPTFAAGIAIGVQGHFEASGATAQAIAAAAYRSSGLAIRGWLAWILQATPLSNYAAALQDNVFFYLEVPYQLCVFAGAYIAALAIDSLEAVAALVTFHS
jgi:hypothetical protein